MIAAAESRAAEMDRPTAIAVVDESGVPKAFSRMDGAPRLAVKLAQDGGGHPLTPPPVAAPVNSVPMWGTNEIGGSRHEPQSL